MKVACPAPRYHQPEFLLEQLEQYRVTAMPGNDQAWIVTQRPQKPVIVPEVLSTSQAAALLRLSHKVVKELCKEFVDTRGASGIPVMGRRTDRPQSHYRLKRSDVLGWAKARDVNFEEEAS